MSDEGKERKKLVKLIKNLPEYFAWRDLVIQKDRWMCQKCREKGIKNSSNLQAHHIKSISQLVIDYNIKTPLEASKCKEIWNIKNGLTLCHDCHKETDSYSIKLEDAKENN